MVSMEVASLAISSYLLILPIGFPLVFSLAKRLASSEAILTGSTTCLLKKTAAKATAMIDRRMVENAIFWTKGRLASSSSLIGLCIHRIAATSPEDFVTGTRVVICGCCPSVGWVR